MNSLPTVAAPAQQQSAPPRCDLELADYDLYVAAVLAESARLFNARSGK